MADSRHSLTAHELASYEEKGFVVLRGVVPEDARQAVTEAMTRAVEKMARAWKDEGLISDSCDELPFETRWAALRQQVPPKFPVSWRRILVSRGVYELWQRPEILGRARRIIGDEVYAHGIWNGRPREPGTAGTQKVDWHQDAHYYKNWNQTDGKLISCWMPLVPVDERSGCLEFLPGSHRSGILDRVIGDNGLFTVPRSALEGYAPVSVPAEPGDLIIFSDTTVHQALDNVADYVRWSIDIRFGEPTPEIISKTHNGYYCFSAADPSRVESYETWAQRHEYTYEELLDKLETRASSREPVSVDAVAKALGVSRAELDAF
jgi:phytanoyl-CoA hydroxylase